MSLAKVKNIRTCFTGALSGSLASNDLELVIGLDMQDGGSFLMPTKEDITIFPDPMLHRQQRAGYYGWGELGFAVLDNRNVICGSA
jgi:hypothetical protein